MSIENVLKSWVESIKQLNPEPTIGEYFCPQDFILQNGIKFDKVIPLPKGIAKGKQGLCHKNSYFTVLKNKEELFYVEGYCICRSGSNFLIPHAWVTNRNLEVIDPTLEFDSKYQYFGVIINFDYVHEFSFKNKRSQLIFDAWDYNFPLMRDNKKNWVVMV